MRETIKTGMIKARTVSLLWCFTCHQEANRGWHPSWTVVVSVYVLNIWQVAAKDFAAENPKAKLVVDLWPQLLISHVLTARCLRFAILQHICRLLAMWPRHNTPPFVILFKTLAELWHWCTCARISRNISTMPGAMRFCGNGALWETQQLIVGMTRLASSKTLESCTSWQSETLVIESCKYMFPHILYMMCSYAVVDAMCLNAETWFRCWYS